MTGAIGATPRALEYLDDCILDAQCSADAQLDNTALILERLEHVFADGQVDDRDEQDLLYVLRHARLEHRLNEEQCSLLKWARMHCNKVAELVAGYRSKLRAMKRAAWQSGSHEITTQG